MMAIHWQGFGLINVVIFVNVIIAWLCCSYTYQQHICSKYINFGCTHAIFFLHKKQQSVKY